MLLSTETEISKPRVSIPGLQIRAMAIADVQRVSELEKEFFSTPWSSDGIAFEVAHNPFAMALVAEAQGVVVAYVIGWFFEDEAHIGTFSVDRAFRRNGVGNFLLASFIARMKSRKARKIHLEVRPSNLAALNLYFKHGFERVGLRKNYYTREKEDALLLSLYLEEGENDGLV